MGHIPPPIGAYAPHTEVQLLPTGVLYRVDSSRATFGELWRDIHRPTIPIYWLMKLLRARLPGAVNCPNVESLEPFEVPIDQVPQDVRRRMSPMLRELEAFGFETANPICHAIFDLFNNSKLHMMTVWRADGSAIARIYLRTEGTQVPPKTHFYCEVITELTDGNWVWTTGARATLNPPPQMHLYRQVDAMPSQLWAAHQQLIQGLSVRPANDVKSVMQMLDRHHAPQRDLYLRRKLFTPMSDSDLQTASAVQNVYNESSASGFQYPEVLAEMERIQNKKTNWINAVLILAVTLILFAAAGVGSSDPASGEKRSLHILSILIAVLIFHELGHFVAMKIFRYRNVRMFFIPFLGAAVSGQSCGAPAWKKALVALMGPVPGILVGSMLGIFGVVLHRPLLVEISLMALLLNGSNLLPVLPLDGGRVMGALFFSRHYAADITFRVLAGIILVLIGALTGGKILIYLGAFMLLGIPLALRTGRIANDLKREGVNPCPNDQKIPTDVAQMIITRLKAAFPRGMQRRNKAMATNALNVYENLCTRPPGWGATIGFTALYLVSFIISIVMAIFLALAPGGRFSDLARAAASQPKNRISPDQIVVAQAASTTHSTTQPTWPRNTIVVNLANQNDAIGAFNDWHVKLDGDEAIERFGQSLIVSLPASDDAERKRWVSAVEARTNLFRVNSGESGLGTSITLTCTTLSSDAADAIVEELDEYFRLPHSLYLIPPWSPDAHLSVDQRYARQTFHKLQQTNVAGYSHPKIKQIELDLANAHRHGDQAQAKQLYAQQAALVKSIKDKALLDLRNSTDPTIDHAIVEQYLAIPTFKPTTRALSDDDDEVSVSKADIDAMDAIYLKMGARMGQMPIQNGKPVPGADRYSAMFGSASHVSLLITFQWMSFTDPFDGPSAMVRWLTNEGCGNIKYEFHIGTDGATFN